MSQICPRKINLTTQRGVALLEVLIVFFVLSVGLLGMAALQMKSIQYNQSAYMRSQATVAANDMLDRIRLNGGVPLSTGTGSDYQAWEDFLGVTLPGGSGAVDCSAPPRCQVTVQWTDRVANAATGSTTSTVVIASQM